MMSNEDMVEAVAADVHAAWMETKRSQGVTSRRSEWGEEQMVPYADLSERAKDLDRGTVRAVLATPAIVELERVRRVTAAERHEVEQILGAALGCPPYPDGGPGVCVGEATIVTLAQDAAPLIRAGRQLRDMAAGARERAEAARADAAEAKVLALLREQTATLGRFRKQSGELVKGLDSLDIEGALTDAREEAFAAVEACAAAQVGEDATARAGLIRRSVQTAREQLSRPTGGDSDG